MSYQVVFEYTREAGAEAGLRFRITFQSKDDFEASKADPENTLTEVTRVVEEGVSDKRAIELCQKVPLLNRLLAARAHSIGSDGLVDPDVLAMELGMVRFALSLDTEDVSTQDPK